MSAEDALYASLGITPADLPISDRPINEWSNEQLQRATYLLRTCRETYGVGESRKLFTRIGMPVPSSDLIEPLPGGECRHLLAKGS